MGHGAALASLKGAAGAGGIVVAPTTSGYLGIGAAAVVAIGTRVAIGDGRAVEVGTLAGPGRPILISVRVRKRQRPHRGGCHLTLKGKKWI